MARTGNGIASAWDIQNYKVKGSFWNTQEPSGRKFCPTKNEINNSARVLSVKEVSSASTINYCDMGTPHASYHIASIGSGSGYTISGSSGISNTNTGSYVSKIKLNQYLNSNSTTATVYVNYPGFSSSVGSIFYNYSFLRYTLTCGASGYNKTTISIRPIYYRSTNSTAAGSYYNSDCTHTGILRGVILDSNKNIVKEFNIRTGTITNNLISHTVTWNGTANATYYYCVAPYNTQWKFTTGMTGYVYVWVGYYSSLVHTAYSTWYDSNQLVKYSDVKASNTFTMNYTFINNKKSDAKVDSVSFDYATSSSSTSGTWASVGSKTISTVAGWATLNGTISCTWPSGIGLIPTTTYYLRLKIGNTTLNQKWYYSLDGTNWTLHNSSSKSGISKAYKVFPSSQSEDSIFGCYGATGKIISRIYIKVE